MKKITTTVLASLLFCSTVLQSGCFGEFAFVRAVYEWNDDVSDNEFVKTIVMYGLMIVPVYEIAGFADIFVLNLIEFSSGSNPMSMNEDEQENQLVNYRGKDYQLTATKNQLKVEQLNGKKKGATASLLFDEDSNEWSIESNQKKLRVAKMIRNKYNKTLVIKFFQPKGEIITVPYSNDGLAMINELINQHSDLAVNE